MSETETTIPLSERELQVLEMVATGASNQQIARQLVISVNTVKVHLRNIFEKLEVQSRTEATLRAIQEGWIVVADNGGPQAEVAPPKTYLLAANKPLVLARWQQVYLALATLLALAMVVTPLLPQETPYLPKPISPWDEPESGQEPEEALPPLAPSLWASHASMPTGRAGLGVAVYEDRIFAIGGRRGDIGATRLVEIYDPASDSWTEGPAKPTATTDMATAVLDGKIYVPGGCVARRQPVDLLEIYDPAADRWQEGSPLPAPRCGYGLIAYQDKLYLFGGWNGEAYEDTIFVYSGPQAGWEVLDTVMPQAKGYFGVAALNDTIYIVGGYNGTEEFNTSHVFMPDTGEWLEKAPLHEKRGGLGLVSTTINLYAIGGGWERPLESSERYDPTTDSWTVFETPFGDNQWSNLGLATVNSRIYAVGGWNGTDEEYMDAVKSYQVVYELFFPISGK